MASDKNTNTKMKFFKRYLNKTIAKQLRRPSGILANKVGSKMNETNNFLYDFTIDALQLRDNESILEIGFGNGKFFDKLFSTADNLRISGLDFSAEMVKEATNNNQPAVNSGRLTLRLGSSDQIPFPDNSFDKVFCINVIYFWERPSEHLREIYRVLKPGGKFYTSIRTKDSLEKMPFAKYGFNMYTSGEWINILEANLLHLVHTEKTQNEPETVLDGQPHQLESLCIVAEKKNSSI